MPEDKISPEEKLLNLIRTPKGVSGEKDEAILPPEKIIKRPQKKIYLKGFLIFIIAVLFVIIAYESRTGIKPKNRLNLAGHLAGQNEKKVEKEYAAVLKPYIDYSQALEGKSLFSPLITETLTVPISRGEKIAEICKRYRLKGVILLGGTPEAVIEDTQSQRAFTVTIGDNMDKVQVIDIKEGRVTLGYENETYDLVF